MLSLAFLGLLGAAVVSDLRSRVVPRAVLVLLALLALWGRPWPWWVATAAALLAPRREWAVYLLPLPLVAGVLTGEGAPAVALVVGLLAWYFRWWGGADSALLAVLALRYGVPGLWASAAALLVGGLAVLALRRRSLRSVAAVGLTLMVRGASPEDGEIPAGSEIPAAAVLGTAGIALEILRLSGGMP
jgi:Flp pilus assembly protein protease CpaA